ncbi:MAG TPA: PilZ domain-containing protein [Thermodesulfovibrionales bacterium]|nr:PilZ domain-containing protein [Thermodesulfovibrionales bacterium]
MKIEGRHSGRSASGTGKISLSDKKAERRGSLRALIKVSVNGVFQDDFFYAVAQNISTSGILFETDKLLVEGDKIACSFVLQHKIDIDGEVVRSERKTPDLYHCGVRFLNLDPKAKAEIEELVAVQKRQGERRRD